MNRYVLSKAGIDVNQGIRRMNGDQQLFEVLIHRFTQDSHYARLQQALEQKNAEKAFRAAHALKGIAANLSLVFLHADLIPLVEELRAGSLEGTDEMFHAVHSSYQKLIDVLNT